MKLKDVLAITRVDTNVNVVENDSRKIISRYDGKDSIRRELNEREVIHQYVQNDELYIVVV